MNNPILVLNAEGDFPKIKELLAPYGEIREMFGKSTLQEAASIFMNVVTPIADIGGCATALYGAWQLTKKIVIRTPKGDLDLENQNLSDAKYLEALLREHL